MIDLGILTPFVLAIIKAFEAFVNETLISSPPSEIKLEELKTEKDFFSDISAVIALPGCVIGSLAIAFDKQTAIKISSEMLGEEIKEVNSAVKDVIGEIANTVAGNIKEDLASLEFENALPNIYNGTETKLDLPAGFRCFAVDFNSRFGKFTLKVSILDDVDIQRG